MDVALSPRCNQPTSLFRARTPHGLCPQQTRHRVGVCLVPLLITATATVSVWDFVTSMTASMVNASCILCWVSHGAAKPGENFGVLPIADLSRKTYGHHHHVGGS